MKRISLSIFSLLVSIVFVSAQNDKMSFNIITHDFGQIGEKEGRVSFDFIVTNNSQEPLIISSVRASCGCTTPNWTKSPIEPGKTGTISVAYNPAGRPGRFNKSITVATNFSPAPMNLYIKGEVTRLETNPEAFYPVKFGDILFKKTPVLDFGQITLTETKTIKLEIYNVGETAFTPQLVGLPTFITLTGSPVLIPAKTAGVLEFVLNAAEVKKYGDAEGSFALALNSQDFIPYRLNVRDDFTKLNAEDIRNAGRINLSVEELTFNKNAKKTAILKISNSGKTDLNIKAIQPSNPTITFSTSALVVKPREIVEIKINYTPNKAQPVNSTETISIFSDDPRNSLKEVKVVVNL
jgi:hypothetical protein